MKLLLLADIASKQSLANLLREQPDVIVTLGDLRLEILRDLRDIDTPKIGVYGNHCLRGYMEELGITNLHLQTLTLEGVMFGGFEGCVRYNRKAHKAMYTQDEATRLLTGFPKVDVMVTHAPPYGVHDEPDDLTHQGFRIFNRYLHWAAPHHWFHGHTYPQISESTLGRTKIVYTHGHRFYEL